MAYVSFPLVFNKGEHDHNCSVLWSGCLSCVHTLKKKVSNFPVPSGMSLTKLFLAVKNIKLLPGRESLVSDIPAGDGKIDNLFYSVREVMSYSLVHRLRPHCPGESSCSPPYLQEHQLVKNLSFIFLRVWELWRLKMLSVESWMRSSRVVTENLTDNAKVATVLCPISASSDSVESEGRQVKQFLLVFKIFKW